MWDLLKSILLVLLVVVQYLREKLLFNSKGLFLTRPPEFMEKQPC